MKHTTLLVAALTILLVACKKDTTRIIDTGYQPETNIAKFTNSTSLTNPYFPMTPGKKYIYEGQTPDGLEHVEEQRLTTTKTILGIICIVVNFKSYLNGKLIESPKKL